MAAKKRLGEMLVEAGILTEEQLRRAVAEHRKAGLKLGQYLSRQGVVNENQIVDTLSRQLKIEKYHPDRYPIDVGLARLIPIETAQKLQVAPLWKKGRLLAVATTDPLDINALDTIEIIGELKRLPDFKLPPLGGEDNLNNPDLQAMLHSRTVLRPHADPGLCTACGTCVDQCPASALSLGEVEHLPEVDDDTCITCFCCQEICPEKAIELK